MADEHQFQVDGETYSSLDEVPEPFRSQLAAMLDHDPGQMMPEATSMSVTTEQFVVNGVTYDSIDDIPLEIRQQLTGILIDHDTNGGPDPHAGPARAGRMGAPTVAPRPIVQRAGMSSKARLIAAMIVVDVVVLALVLWFVAR
jgi:hypothetical protein